MRKFIWLLSLLGGLLTACSPFVTAPPRPSPQPIQVAYPSALRPWEARLHECASQHPEIALITEEISSLEPGEADLTLWLGEPPEGIPGYAASLGTDQIVIIAGSSINLAQITGQELGDIYAQPGSNYQVWTYAQDNPLRAIFDEAVMGDLQLSPYARLVPHPGAMLEAISGDPFGIGYVPQSWLTDEVRVIPGEQDLSIAFEQPMLALAATEPEGNLRSYLSCLQSKSPQ